MMIVIAREHVKWARDLQVKSENMEIHEATQKFRFAACVNIFPVSVYDAGGKPGSQKRAFERI